MILRQYIFTYYLNEIQIIKGGRKVIHSFSKKRKIYYGTGLAALLIFAGALLWHMLPEVPKTVEAATPVKVFVVGATEGTAAQVYAGEIHSVYESNLSFQTAGKILSRRVKAGDRVRKGQVLAVLDTRDLEQAVYNTQAQESAVNSQLKLAEKNMRRYQQLLAEGAVSEAIYDQYVQQYEAAQAAVEQSHAQSAQTVNQLGYSMLTADREGIVTKIKAEPGQVVAAGDNIATLAVAEDGVENFTIGTSIDTQLWSRRKNDYAAVIREISPMADAETRTFQIKAQLQGDLSAVRLGMTAKVFLRNGGEKKASYIPLAAVLEQSDQGKGVWVIHDGRVYFASVELGELRKDQVEVLSGLAQGERIVAAGGQKLSEGQMVGGIEN